MIYTPLTRKAMKIAYEAHNGQYDVSGVPYIFHPMEVASCMEDEYTTCIALLHDVVEDTGVTFEQLSKEFPAEVLAPLKLLTHMPRTDYFEYIKNIKTDPTAIKVKLADIRHNMDETRVDGADVPKEKLEWWRTKYTKALEILNNV